MYVQKPQAQKSTMGSLLAPDFYGSMRRGGGRGSVKDHARENYRAIKEAERMNRSKQDEAVGEKKRFKLKQFEAVQSRLYDAPKRADQENSAATEKKSFMRRGAREDLPTPAETLEKQRKMKAKQLGAYPPSIPQHHAESDNTPTPRKGVTPARTDMAKLKPREDVSFIDRNRARAAEVAQRNKDLERQKRVMPAKHQSFGKTPDYIHDRKVQLRLEAEDRRAALPDPDAPEGMCKMDEGERLEMVEQLKQRLKELNEEHYKLPLNIQTYRHKQKQLEIEGELKQVERSLKIFDRPIVYIQA